MPTDVEPKSTLQARLRLEAARLKQTAAAFPAGDKRDAVLNKARQYDNALHINEWLGAPGLQPAR